MHRLRYVFILLLAVFPSRPVLAANDPPVIVAAADVVATNSRDDALCHGAALDPKRPDRIKLAVLVDATTDPNATYSFGYEDITPLGLAVLAEDVSLLNHLFERGAHWSKDSGDSMVLYQAGKDGSPAMLKALMRHGLSPNFRQSDEWSSLMAASWANRLDNVMVLLEAGADANVALPNGNSALLGAVVCKNQRMVDALVSHGARPDVNTMSQAKKRGISLSVSRLPVGG